MVGAVEDLAYGIPWLIWIQILVLLLFLVLLACFTLSPADSSFDTPSSSSFKISSLGTDSPVNIKGSTVIVSSSGRCLRGESSSMKGEIGKCSSIRVVGEDIPATAKDASPLDLHPCNYFKIATLAFLKCFGLENMDEQPSKAERKKKR